MSRLPIPSRSRDGEGGLETWKEGGIGQTLFCAFDECIKFGPSSYLKLEIWNLILGIKPESIYFVLFMKAFNFGPSSIWNWKLETWNWKQILKRLFRTFDKSIEFRPYWKLETGNWKLDKVFRAIICHFVLLMNAFNLGPSSSIAWNWKFETRNLDWYHSIISYFW